MLINYWWYKRVYIIKKNCIFGTYVNALLSTSNFKHLHHTVASKQIIKLSHEPCVWNLSGLATHQSLNWCAKQIYRKLNISLLDVEIAQPPKHDAKLWISIRKGRSCMQGVTCMQLRKHAKHVQWNSNTWHRNTKSKRGQKTNLAWDNSIPGSRRWSFEGEQKQYWRWVKRFGSHVSCPQSIKVVKNKLCWPFSKCELLLITWSIYIYAVFKLYNTCLRINSLSWLQLLVLTQVLCIAQAITNATVRFVQQWSAHGLVCSNGPKHLQFGINLKHQPHNRAGRGDPNLMLLGGTCCESLLV